ncbi:MAG: hypothetical protein HOF96_12435 [Candidatus Marinimicrobia bacterium]|nr:hypothetical protein [Candidatus Neomarinimicrobiota bacterium]MBT4033664.1 hypothetical protein [Candidatus Neomarinimicrobiota bacterium]MBT4362035.1 hypothetical protein [Candidatus Neomarinimicrobiota bacterium]MBT4421484.1 hypothetical protein [Candidatus Neomarinimicrobiota bacterium]MBT4946425.1 hypothetical protein [Candidatus Neomarinimicrobiota bacterium]
MIDNEERSTAKFEVLDKIIDGFNSEDEFRITNVFLDGGVVSPFGRLKRAALNQSSDESASLSRYGIWASTVRDNLIEVDRMIASGNLLEAKKTLCRSANSVAAFAEIQGHFESHGVSNPGQLISKIEATIK